MSISMEQNLNPSDSVKINFINSPFSRVYDKSKEKTVKKIEEVKAQIFVTKYETKTQKQKCDELEKEVTSLKSIASQHFDEWLISRAQNKEYLNEIIEKNMSNFQHENLENNDPSSAFLEQRLLQTSTWEEENSESLVDLPARSILLKKRIDDPNDQMMAKGEREKLLKETEQRSIAKERENLIQEILKTQLRIEKVKKLYELKQQQMEKIQKSMSKHEEEMKLNEEKYLSEMEELKKRRKESELNTIRKNNEVIELKEDNEILKKTVKAMQKQIEFLKTKSQKEFLNLAGGLLK